MSEKKPKSVDYKVGFYDGYEEGYHTGKLVGMHEVLSRRVKPFPKKEKQIDQDKEETKEGEKEVKKHG